jgi:hypothetical protein
MHYENVVNVENNADRMMFTSGNPGGYSRTDSLNSIMQFDHIIISHGDGTIDDETNITRLLSGVLPRSPELIDGHLSVIEQDLNGWELLDGYSGQFGYRGPIMHSSEFIGGKMADHILENAGYYVAIVAETSDVTPDGEAIEPDGWAVAYKPIAMLNMPTPTPLDCLSMGSHHSNDRVTVHCGRTTL